jgi:hypothetical protein
MDACTNDEPNDARAVARGDRSDAVKPERATPGGGRITSSGAN